MSIQITDCTIRDGGYLFNKNPSCDYIKGVMQGLADAGIDFVETGFLQKNVSGESLVYHNSVDVRRYLPKNNGHTNFLGFCDNSRYSPDLLDEYDGQSFKWLRISFAKYEIAPSLEFCRKAQEKGYIVQFNPMDAISYSEEEWEDLISQVNQIMPGSLSIVDTFGAMYLEDLIRIFTHLDRILYKGIKIGLHSHDNLGLSNALAETMIYLAEKTGRDVVVDGSLFGMGRGAGNANTELLADYINKHHNGHYNIPALMDTIEKYIVPLNIRWGYDLPMFVCGIEHAHVDNVYHLLKTKGSTAREMLQVIQKMSVPQRTRYGSGYSKEDFTVLDEAYNKYKEETNELR